MIGPNDKRRNKSRCTACARRKIKCEAEGGWPCVYCKRNGYICLAPTQKNEADASLMVVQSYVIPRAGKPQPCQRLPQEVSLDLPTRLAKHFFSVFMIAHDFVGNQHLDVGTIAGLCQSHPSLQNATVAIAALDASRRSQALSPREREIAHTSALNAYRKSLVALRKSLNQKDIFDNDAHFWTTFFLGIFELMCDVTGDGWIKHIQYGTSKLLQLRGPSAPLSDSFRSFFLSFRVYEICRALLFNEYTFLDEPGWKKLMLQIWEDNRSEYHPKEDILDLMICGASLNMRIQALDEKEVQPSIEELCNFANEGLQIQASLRKWPTTLASWTATSSQDNKQSFNASKSIIAKAFYHAITIFLSGIFDYRPYWTRSEQHINVPILHQIEVQQHVSAILDTTQSALKNTNLVGLLFFFPLRVAGARARTREQKLQILEILQEISKRNFIVAGAIVEDLSDLWGSF